MRLVNEANAETPFYVGNCKNNTPPKHVAVEGKITEGTETREVTIAGEAATLIKSPKSAEYIYIKRGDKWEYVKDASLFTGGQTTFNEVPKAEPKPKAEKAEGEKKAGGKAKGDTPESIGLDLKAKYDVYGTVMTGEEAKKRFGIKNIKDGLAAEKITLVTEDEAATADETAAADAGDTGGA
jgi:hypothetical protein